MMRIARTFVAFGVLLAATAMAQTAAPAASSSTTPAPDPEERGNFFGDPFVQATNGIPSCPVPPGPMITRAQMREQAHGRIERGTSCYQAGRCRLPNSYQYDQEIIARVQKAIVADGRFAQTSVWAEGQRRWVWLRGCVQNRAQAQAIAKLVRSIDEVEAVNDELVVISTREGKASRSAAKTR